jgi:sensor c-di-GMP phosphodiesterase-like protein
MTIISVFILFSIFIFLFRRTQALDYDLKTGLKDDEFELHYQPIVDMKTGACVGSEALIRWRHPEEGMLLPGLFIPSAEKTGLIGPIGEWIVKQAVNEQSPLFDGFPLEYVSINLSPIQLNSGSFDNTIKWLSEATLTTERFVFEITEKVTIRESQTTAMDALARVRKLGCSVALDDFGTGYSSLSNLLKFDFGYLKIDQQFVRGINQDIRTNSILEAITDLGHKLGVRIIAEGVETKEQREYLLTLGVQYGQGWLFSIPLPVREFENYLSRLGKPSETNTHRL